MRVLRCCIDMPSLSCRIKLDRLQPKSAVLVDAAHVLEHCVVESQSTRQATVALSSDEFALFALNVGCVAGMLLESCLKGMQLGPLDIDRQTRDLLGLIVCQRNDEEVWCGAEQTHGYATLLVRTELKKRFVRVQRDRHDATPQPLKKDETARANNITTLAVADRSSPPPTGERLTAPVANLSESE